MSNLSEQVAICDELIDNENDINFMVNKIGGLPKFVPQKVFDFQPCKNCSNSMVLISQLYCPLVNSVYHRVFYIAACVNQNCWNKLNSWQVYRSQFPDFEYIKNLEASKTEKENKLSSFINKDWGCEASDWEIDDDNENDENDDDDIDSKDSNDNHNKKEQILNNDTNLSNLTFTEAITTTTSTTNIDETITGFDKLDISSSENSSICLESPEAVSKINENIKEMFNNWKLDLFKNQTNTKLEFNSINGQFGYFQSYYLNVMNKELFIDYDNNNKKVKNINLDDYKDAAIDDKSITKAEEYEESNLKHGDKIFYKFRKAIDYCPYQVIRYARGSNPLFIKTHNDFTLNQVKCSYCGANCNFEFQLMPALVNYLKTINNNNSIEFGVVIIYTCSNSCWNETDLYRLEHVYVQSDPDDKLFK